ncbi:unnamed protein product, partial [Polarella glacialis]
EANSKNIGLIFELIDGVTLDKFMKEESRPVRCDKRKISLLTDVASALRYLHWLTRPIIHGDIKDTNVFVEMWERGPKAKLADFGLSRLIDSRRTSKMGGTMRWMAPEILQTEPAKPAKSADVFSFGRLTSFMLTGVKPCMNMQRADVIAMARENQQPYLEWPSGNSLCERLTNLGEQCVSFSRKARPAMTTVAAELQECFEFFEELVSASAELVPFTVSDSQSSLKSAGQAVSGQVTRGETPARLPSNEEELHMPKQKSKSAEHSSSKSKESRSSLE